MRRIFVKNSGGHQSFVSFSKLFQLCTHAKIMMGRSREWRFVRRIFEKKSWRTLHSHELFKNISTVYPCYSHEKWIKWKVIVRATYFCGKFWATSQFHEFFIIISTLYPQSLNVDQMKSNVSCDFFCEKILANNTVSLIFRYYKLSAETTIKKCKSDER